MQRRKFIGMTSIATVAGLLVPNLLISCSGGEKINLNDIIGKPENLLEQFPKEGDSDFAYYMISNFEHDFVQGNEVFIYCQKGKIVGYTVREKGSEQKNDYIKQLSQKYGDKKQVFTNDFGEEYEWEKDGIKVILCYTNEQSNWPQNTYYSEATLGEQLIVF